MKPTTKSRTLLCALALMATPANAVKHLAWCLALSSVTISAVGQSLQINVERPAHGYEVLNVLPDAVSQCRPTERSSATFSPRSSWHCAFEDSALASCPELVGGKIKVMEFATRLDREVERMNRAISAAYEGMSGRLSSQGRTALQVALNTATLKSADTKAVAVAETSPAAAESAFLKKCADAGCTAQAVNEAVGE